MDRLENGEWLCECDDAHGGAIVRIASMVICPSPAMPTTAWRCRPWADGPTGIDIVQRAGLEIDKGGQQVRARHSIDGTVEWVGGGLP